MSNDHNINGYRILSDIIEWLINFIIAFLTCNLNYNIYNCHPLYNNDIDWSSLYQKINDNNSNNINYS